MNKGHWVGVIILVGLCLPAFAGGANIAFSCDTGPLNYKVSGSGDLTSSGGRAAFSGPNTTMLAQSGSPVYSSSTVGISMTLQPSVDAVNGVGLVMIDSGGDDPLTATVSSNGDVMLCGYGGLCQSTYFTYPAALNNTLTLTYDPLSDTATVTVTATPPMTRSVSLPLALFGNGSVQTGVFANGPGGFSSFAASGASIPNYASPVFGFASLPGVGLKELNDPMILRVQVTAASGNVSYQWLKNGAPLSGQIAPTYEVAALVATDAGSYVCRVTDACGVVHNTPPAVLTVLPENSVPAAGTAGLCALMALMTVASALVLRRRAA
jgi:hypothetical protein